MDALTDHVRAIVRLHPFREERTEVAIPQGQTIERILELSGLPTDIAGAVHVDGVRVPRHEWAITRPSAGSLVTSRAVPQGRTGKIIAGSVLVIIGALLIATGIGAPFGIPLIATGLGLIAGGVFFQGQQTLPNFNAGPRQQLKPFITGTRNELRPYGVVPVVLGHRVRYRPPYAARPYSSWQGNRQRFHALMTFGHGPVRLENLKFGDTPIEALKLTVLANAPTTPAQEQAASFRIREGWSDDDTVAPMVYYLDQVSEDPLQVELKFYSSGTNRADWSYRRSDTAVDRIGVEVNFPSGLIQFDASNNPQKLDVEIEVEYAVAGTSPTSTTGWLKATGRDENGQLNKYNGLKVNDARRSAFSIGIDWTPASGTPGQYDIRLRRKTPDRNKLTQIDDSIWSLVRNYRLGNPIRLTGLCTVACDILATGTLTGELDSFNAEASYMGTYYDAFGGSWVTPTRTSTPSLWKSAQAAAHFRYVLQGAANRAPLADGRIDLTTLATWASSAQTAGLFFNGVIDGPGNVFDRLNEIASYARASLNMRDGKFSVVTDITQPGAAIQKFTPREYSDFQHELTFPEAVHALRVQYADNSKEGSLAEIVVYDDGYTVANATIFEALTLVYCRDKDQAWKQGRRALAERRLRRERYSFECVDVHANCTRGDIVELGIEGIDTVLKWGRVLSVTLSAGNAVSITVDEALTFDGVSSYLFRFRKSSGVTLDRSIGTPAATTDTNAATFAVAIPSGDPQPVAGDLFLFATSTTFFRRCLVYSIEHHADLRARLVLIDEAPGVYTADTSTASTATASNANNAAASQNGSNAVLKIATASPTGPGTKSAGIVVAIESRGRSGTVVP